MKKILLLLVALALVIFGAYYLSLNTNNLGKKRELIKELTPLKCDLNVNDCEYMYKGKKVKVSLNPKPIQSLEELHLKIYNLGDFKKLNARIYGLNMFMGDIIPKFIKFNNTDYRAILVLSACVLDVMRFRAEFFDEEKNIGFYFDFDVKR